MRLGSIIVIACALLAFAAAAFAQDYTGKTVGAIQVTGLERVSEQVMRSKLEVQTGQAFNPRAVARDIRRLYDLGFFDTIKVIADLKGDRLELTYQVAEKRVIDEVKIIGNRKVKMRKIREVLTMREGQSFNPDAYGEERSAILKLYESKGFANANVDMVVEKVGPSRVRIVYDIRENRKARIRKIAFEGNDTVKAHQLKKVMKSKRGWWIFGGKYEEDKFEKDLANVLDEYGNRGHLEADVTGTDIDYVKDGKRMVITVHVSEGPVYHVESLDVASNEVYDTDEVTKLVKVNDGEVHNKGQVAKDAEEITKKYQDSGYINAVDTAQVTLDKEKKTTHIVHNVSEGELKYLREINVTGNEVTKDEVIRREMLLKPGDRYDGTLKTESQRRLEATQYFDEARLTVADLEDKNLFTDLNADVKEGKTGTFNFGAGYSTEEGIGGFGELRLNNFDITNWPKFSGGGQELVLRTNVGQVRTQYNLSFTDPELFGYPLTGGFDLFNEVYHVPGGASYSEGATGTQLRFGKQLSPYVTLSTSLRVEEDDLTGLPKYGHPDLIRQAGTHLVISNTWRIERDTRDNRRDAVSGSKHSLSATLAGFGGDYNFYRLEHESTWYKGLGEDKKWVLSFRMREGIVRPYGGSDYVPLQDRMFAGGTDTIRGYKTRWVGPRAREYVYWGKYFALGGDMRAITNLELKYKVTKILRLYSFLDGGGVWDFDNIDFGTARASVGVGIGFDVPRLGPIRVDIGYPLNPDKNQGRSPHLHLLTGFRF